MLGCVFVCVCVCVTSIAIAMFNAAVVVLPWVVALALRSAGLCVLYMCVSIFDFGLLLFFV